MMERCEAEECRDADRGKATPKDPAVGLLSGPAETFAKQLASSLGHAILALIRLTFTDRVESAGPLTGEACTAYRNSTSHPARRLPESTEQRQGIWNVPLSQTPDIAAISPRQYSCLAGLPTLHSLRSPAFSISTYGTSSFARHPSAWRGGGGLRSQERGAQH